MMPAAFASAMVRATFAGSCQRSSAFRCFWLKD